MIKKIIYWTLYIILIAVLIYFNLWILLIIAILAGLFFLLIPLLAMGLEQGFRNQFPFDFLMSTSWVIDYFEKKGYALLYHNTDDSNHPYSTLIKDNNNVKVILNAPLSASSYSISVVISGKEEQCIEIPTSMNREDAFKLLDDFSIKNQATEIKD